MLRLALIPLLLSLAASLPAAEREAFVRIVPDRLIAPEVKQIAVEPGTAIDLWLVPKVGDPLRIASSLKVEAGKTADVKLSDTFGILTVRGDGLPRLGKIVVTSENDPGPDEKGHLRVQFAEDYRTEMILPAGTYRIWIVPHNGARATKIEDAVRILAGRTATVD